MLLDRFARNRLEMSSSPPTNKSYAKLLQGVLKTNLVNQAELLRYHKHLRNAKLKAEQRFLVFLIVLCAQSSGRMFLGFGFVNWTSLLQPGVPLRPRSRGSSWST